MEFFCRNYEEWKHCITVKCKIPLTADYVEKRIAALSNTQDRTTARFIALYGDEHRLRTIEWFKQARAEVANQGRETPRQP